jgi:hypothetical protein
MLEYTYPDGLGTGGTFTDGDTFSQDSIQTIIDEVVARTRADENNRIIKLLGEQPHHNSSSDFAEPCWCDYSYGDAITIIKNCSIYNSIIHTKADNVINNTESKSVARRLAIENGEHK